MHNLSVAYQRAYYHRQKQETHGNQLVEIPLPNFEDLDVPSSNSTTPLTLCKFAFSLSKPPHSIRLDIDNGTRSSETVIRVHKDYKILAKNLIANWLMSSMKISITWDKTRKYNAKVFHLDFYLKGNDQYLRDCSPELPFRMP